MTDEKPAAAERPFAHPPRRIETLTLGHDRDERAHDFTNAPNWQDYGFLSLAAFQAWAKAGGGWAAFRQAASQEAF